MSSEERFDRLLESAIDRYALCEMVVQAQDELAVLRALVPDVIEALEDSFDDYHTLIDALRAIIADLRREEPT